MGDLKKQERTAIEAVARRFSATWEKGGYPPDAQMAARSIVSGSIEFSRSTARKNMPNSSDEACTLEVRRKVVLRLSPSKTPPKIWVLHYSEI